MADNSVEKHLIKAMQALDKKVSDLDSRVHRQEQINRANSQELAEMQQQLTEMRNQAILVAIDNGTPYREIGERHRLSAGRIAQIKKEYFQ